MNTILLAAASALWLGLLTSVSPCPLATNIAATTMLARRMANLRRAMISVLAYTLGRVAAYVAIAGAIFAGLASMPELAAFLRQGVLPIVGPILILAGMAILDWLPLPPGFKVGSESVAEKISHWGLLGEFALGALFALSFCPVSAALFFGSLLPLAAASSLSIFAVVVYGIGTALPVGILALLTILSAETAGKVLRRVQSLQRGALIFTGSVLILIGGWLTLTDTLKLI
ncbi:aromatic aminobenezylarsenical efflux permease ArsG family transporter [Haloferula rosea]|uniref:Sulfite exporter TauE/SafE family protein n=1 Tax=Haloferula rosea TaxID=490093 RepID=A0A934RD07_9BACT|nr:aromatic aminobenezylarsenical efflux permease ArsG family transporter [Haloferula rosea]MBK1828922.1 sulfite exporter TauE/SafE family protein [Haloferula rosea]